MKPHRPAELDRRLSLPSSGLLFVGERGKLLAGYAGGNPFGEGRRGSEASNPTARGLPGGLLLPEEKFREVAQPPQTLSRVEHYREWTMACKTGARTACPVEFGCEMTEVALLGALALRTRRGLEWDSAAMRVTNADEANRLVDPPSRSGWELPDIS